MNYDDYFELVSVQSHVGAGVCVQRFYRHHETGCADVRHVACSNEHSTNKKSSYLAMLIQAHVYIYIYVCAHVPALNSVGLEKAHYSILS